MLPFLRPYRKLAIASILLIVLTALAGLLVPWPLKVIVDSVLGDEPLPSALQGLLGPLAQDRIALLVLSVLAGLVVTSGTHGLLVLSNYATTRLQQSMVLDFRSDLFQHAQRLSMSYYDQGRSGNLIYAINFLADEAIGLITAIEPLAQSLLTLIGMFWILWHIDQQVAQLSLAVLPFLYCSVGYYATHIQQRILRVKTMEAETLSIIHEAISMMRVIFAFGRENHEYRRFRSQGERAVNARVDLTVRQTVFSLVVNMITAGGTALVLGFAAYHVLQGQVTVGQMLVVLAYLASVYQPLEAISYTVGSLQDKFVGLQMAYGLRDTLPDILDAPDAIPLEQAKGHIRFEKVRFTYPTRTDTLKGISFEARPGQVIAIVGPTGAGKTTLVSLIPRFYDLQGGGILVDGADIRSFTVRSLRQQISIVLQEPVLFSATVADNIRYGRLDASLDDIVEAAKAANAHNFIVELPHGYATELGERGAQLSVGERQRIAVARAFLKDASILILDEPTSSVDSATESVILEALERLMVGRTTFLIAHRLATVRNADFILVLDHGELVEQGTHEELLERQGLYWQLHEAQALRPRRETALVTRPVGTGDGWP